MKIETKKDIGDKVFFMYNDRIVSSKIVLIEILVTKEETSIDYKIKTPSGNRTVDIGAETKKELIKKLLETEIKL